MTPNTTYASSSDHALLQELSSLNQASLHLEHNDSHALRKTRTLKADTKKNRKELFDAIESKNLSELTRLIEWGVPLNILDDKERGWTKKTPLSCCAAMKWPEGAQALLEAGADDTLIPEYLSAQTPPSGQANPLSCLEIAGSVDSPDCFKLYFHRMPTVYQERSIQYITNATLYLALEELGEAHRLPQARLFSLAQHTLDGLNPSLSSVPAHALNKRAFQSIFSRLSLSTHEDLGSQLWLHALRTKNTSVIQALAQMKCKLPDHGRLSLVPKDCLITSKAPERFLNRRKAPTTYQPHRIETSFNEQAAVPVQAGLATAALLVQRSYGADYALPYALCAIEPLRRELLENPLGIHMLSHCVDLPLHKRLSSLGADLSSFLDDTGKNPLHRAAKAGESMALMEHLAKLCTEWISQRDSEGKTPCEYIDSGRRPQMSTAFDQIGMREGLGGKRGAQVKPESRRRL